MRSDIAVGSQRCLDALEGLVSLEPQTVGIENQSVARDTRRVVVVAAEAAVDHKQLAVRADRQLASDGAHGSVTVHDVRVR